MSSLRGAHSVHGTTAILHSSCTKTNPKQLFFTDENYREFPPINETAIRLQEGFVGSLLQVTCSGTNVSCPKIDARARALNLKYKEGLDLIFVLDASSSIKTENFNTAKGFLKEIVEIFGISDRYVPTHSKLYIHLQIHIHFHIHMHIDIHIHVHVHIHIPIHLRIHIHIHTFTYTPNYIHTYMYMGMCMCMCMRVFMCNVNVCT